MEASKGSLDVRAFYLDKPAHRTDNLVVKLTIRGDRIHGAGHLLLKNKPESV